METELYTCEFCKTKFKPKRRKIQKFCSPTCRSKNHHHKNRVSIDKSVATETIKEPSKIKVEEMSFAAVGNAATGVLIIQLLTKLLTKIENKPATKKDIQELENLVKKRCFLIQNMDRRYDGYLPYFAMETNSLIYLKDANYCNPSDNII